MILYLRIGVYQERFKMTDIVQTLPSSFFSNIGGILLVSLGDKTVKPSRSNFGVKLGVDLTRYEC